MMKLGEAVRDLGGLKGVVQAIRYIDGTPVRVQVTWMPGDHTSWIKPSFLKSADEA